MGSRHRGRSRSPRRGSGSGSAPTPITQDDYYRLNAPFRLWLRKEKDRYFDELASDKARRYFASFVRAWNDGRLGAKYYTQDGELRSLARSVVTRHDWGFAAADGGNGSSGRQQQQRQQETAATVEDPMVAEERREDERRRRRRERREARERAELVLDEVAPKETGREARIAKRRNLNEMRHGERSLDAEIPDNDIHGEAGADLAALKRERDAQERRRQQRRQQSRDVQARDQRLSERADKERATIEALRAMAQQSREQGLGMMPRRD
ncbi:hypothetical protein H4R18_005447 [Coemansia javaensis]|uniref:Uncharacterized protein n=1 Tax=Coemansia javaensis TaxID=2761396 RepID=A0A9W8H528_9FUNG|nr:hypothetical protein H4R18_005447 [Coemansia javaensis]